MTGSFHPLYHNVIRGPNKTDKNGEYHLRIRHFRQARVGVLIEVIHPAENHFVLA